MCPQINFCVANTETAGLFDLRSGDQSFREGLPRCGNRQFAESRFAHGSLDQQRAMSKKRLKKVWWINRHSGDQNFADTGRKRKSMRVNVGPAVQLRMLRLLGLS
jgi:hypothetical protein